MIRCRQLKLSSVVLGAAMSLAATGCKPAIPRGMDSPSALSQELASPKTVPYRSNDDIFRLRLLMADAVQKELGLTADQIGQIEEFVRFSSQRSRELAAMWSEVSSSKKGEVSEARTREFGAWTEDAQRKQKEFRAKLLGMLTPTQVARLEQIRLQQTLASALTQPEFIKALCISDEQLARIRPLSDPDEEKQLAELRELGDLKGEQLHKKFIVHAKERDQAQVKANRLALDVLTPEQQAKLDEFVGRKLEVTWDVDALMRDDGGSPF